MTATRITSTMRLALRYLVEAGGRGETGTETRLLSTRRLTAVVHGGVARRLADAGLIRTETGQPGCRTIVITDEGRAEAAL